MVLSVLALVVAAKVEEIPVALQPFGAVRQSDLATVKQGLQSFYHVEVVVLKSRPLPAAAYYSPRSRYRAEKLLSDLTDRRPEGIRKMVGLTASDISTTTRGVKDWGIFGLGNVGGASCVVSTYRLGRSQVSSREFAVRLSNVARHELGHTFGLEHCPTPGCLMGDAGGSIKSVQGTLSGLCSKCRVKLGSDVVR